MKFFKRKGQMAQSLNSLVVLGVGIFTVGLVMSLFAYINSNIRTIITNTASNPNNATIVQAELGTVLTTVNQSIASGQQVTTFLSPVALVGVAIVIIGLIVGGIGLRNVLSK